MSRAPWLRLGMEAWWLGFESANVIAQRMVSEKMTAACLLQWRSWLGLLGHTAPEITDGSLRHYRKVVRANRRRLERRPKRG